MPETLLTPLSRDSSVDLENNPLADWMQAGLATAMHAGHYAGPQVFFSTADGAAEVQPRSLQEVAADWLEGEPTAMATWQHLAREAGAADDARFLDRLRGTVNYGNEAFRQAVAEELRQAPVSPRLREQYFELASGANASCEDRITLAWNGMQAARLNADVEDGVHDRRLANCSNTAASCFAWKRWTESRARRSTRFVAPIPPRTSMKSRSILPTRPSCATRSSCGTSLPTCAS